MVPLSRLLVVPLRPPLTAVNGGMKPVRRAADKVADTEFEARAVPGNPNQVWLRVNQAVTFDQMVAIAQILNKDD